MQSELKELQLNFKEKPKYIYKEKDLVRDFRGKKFDQWALNCVDWLFTKQELISNCVYKTEKSSRGALDEERVKLLRGKLINY